MKIRHIILLIATLLLAGCFKEVSRKTAYILKPLQQPTSTDVARPIAEARAYAFVADTAQWTVATYDDAMNGVITSKSNPAEKRNDAFTTAQPYTQEGTQGWLQLDLNREWQMVVVADPVNRLYAYTQQKIAQNLQKLYVAVVFKPWKSGFSYKDANWLFFNEFYTPPIYLDCIVSPTMQIVENGEELLFPTPNTDLKIYAFDADTTEWRIASLADATAGKITSKGELPARTTPDFPAYKDASGDSYTMKVSSPTLMVVAVDILHKVYAYTKHEVDLNGTSPTFPVLFRPWQKVWIDNTSGWVFVDEQYAPKPEKTTHRK